MLFAQAPCGADDQAYAGAPLISRDVLFGDPDKAAPQLSPDGQYLSYLAPRDGVLNVWVAPRIDLTAAKPVTDDKKRGVRSYFWAYTNTHILYIQDKDGDENWRLYSVDVKTGTQKDLTPLEGVQARVEEVSPKFPDEVLVGLNDRDQRFHDVYRINIRTGTMDLVQQNQGILAFVTDDDFRVRFALRTTPEGGQEILKPTDQGGWQRFALVPPEDALTTGVLGFNKTGDVLYLTDSRGRNTSALMALDLKSNEQKLLAEDPRADMGDVIVHPTEKNIQAVSFTYERTEWKVLDESISRDLDYLRTVADGELYIVDRTEDDQFWLAGYMQDAGPVRHYLYDRAAHRAQFLFTNRRDLESQPLVAMHSVVIPARDGLSLVSYLSLPPGSDPDGDGRPTQPVPMVLFVHGGPWARDSWGYNSYHQWLANRGYAALSVNFRASTGFGKEFVNAGDHEWGGKAHDDLLDAIDWAKREGVALPDKIAIMGGSYGGYAVLVGLTFTPDVFACGVDIVGPSSLVTLLESIPPYWKPILDIFTARIGDHRTDEGRKFLLERSPLSYVDRIQRPLLIGQGANDPRVKQTEADQIVAAMQSKKIPVTYVLYSDEGHGFARPENRMSFHAVAEAFLAQHLGGRFEPIGDDFKGSTVAVPAGADQVPGLTAAIEQQETARADGN